MFKKMPLILLAIIAAVGFSHSYMPLEWKSALYGASLTIKSFIVLFLPFVIFGLLFKTAALFAKSASKTILAILAAICLSNFFSTMLSYGIGVLAYRFDLSMSMPHEGEGLLPWGNFSFPSLVGNAYAMMAGLGLGIAMGRWKPAWAEFLGSRMERGIAVLLKGFLYLLPVFIAGFVVKMYHDGLMLSLVSQYGAILGLVAGSAFAYIFLIHFIASRLQGRSFMQSLKNMAPAAIAGFGSMSSAAAMPLTLIGVEKNSDNPDLARALVPATVNTHLIADCFAIPIFAFAVLKSFGMPDPSFLTYTVFALYFVMAKFSSAAVPGGGILVMLPVLESCLGFDATMLSLITALYILFDPVITSGNVLGNGGFAALISHIFKSKFSPIEISAKSA